MADAGWYPDAHDPNQQHYFDGQNWTGQHRPNPAAPSDDTIRRGDLAAEQQRGQQEQAGQQDYQQGHQGGQPQQQGQFGSQWAQPGQSYGPPPTQQWAQPGQSDHGAYGGHGGHGAAQWQPGPPTPASGGRRNRKPLIIAGVAVVAVVAGLVTFLVWPGEDEPTITYEGKSIAKADATLTAAEKALSTAVSTRKGAKNDETRCYFAKPKKPASGDKASDIDDALRCGPVLFIDGVKTSAYLTVPFTEKTSGSSVELEVRDDLGDIEPAALDTALELVRPDGEKPPTGNGGAGSLAVPQPPAAEKDLLTTAMLTSSSGVKPVGTKVVGKNQRVTLTSAGEIKRYGEGDDARSAPEGQRLIAFQVTYGPGDVDQSNQSPAMLAITGAASRAIPDASGDTYVIAAVPSGTGASVVTTDGGISQSLSLPTGTPGGSTIKVLQRSNRSAVLAARVKVPFSLRQGSRTGKVTYTASATIAALDFWAPGNTNVRAASVANAILSVRLNYTDSGRTYGFSPSLLKLRVGSQTYAARNVAPTGKINNVFEVPATFTSGTLQVSGSTRIDGVTLRVTKTASIPIRISP